VTAEPAADGWTFLSDFDAVAVAEGRLTSKGTCFVHRPVSGQRLDGGRAVAESPEDLFALKAAILPELDAVPYVEQDTPVVCAWYPSARAILLWNLSEEKRDVTVKCGSQRWNVVLAPLDAELLDGIGAA
jgi:hypothetical protein